jgi:hypothetical protein
MVCYIEAHTQDFTHRKQRPSAFTDSKATIQFHLYLHRTDLLNDLSEICRIILKQTLKKYGRSVYTGFVCVKFELYTPVVMNTAVPDYTASHTKGG